uniref:Uncharacterized protein n=1 Tax=Anopheles funestus TaxID=62324 RepID=A0A182RHG7_ANOFN
MMILLEEHELVECVQTNASEMDELNEAPDDTPEVLRKKTVAREERLKQDRKCKSLLVSRIHDSQLEYVQDKRCVNTVQRAQN